MQEMIEKILEADKRAREDLEETDRMRVDSLQKISEMEQEKRAEYIKNARTNIKNLEKTEKIKAVTRIKFIENNYKKIGENIEKIYSENKENWAQALFEKVITE